MYMLSWILYINSLDNFMTSFVEVVVLNVYEYQYKS